MPIQLSGSLVITGSITTTGVITMSGSIASASYSSNSDLLQGTGSVGFATTASLLAVSSSQQQISASLLNVVANYATTGSNSFRANQSITGSLVVSSTITAQTLVVQTVTSSIVYSSGSNIFGSQLANTQTFTGSIYQTGSIAAFFGSVGVGTTSPAYKFDVLGFASDWAGHFKSSAGSQPDVYICDGNANSGIFINTRNTSASYNALSVSNGTNYILTVRNDGYVGIGTTSPSSIFQVASAQSLASIRSTTTTNYAEVQIENTTNYLQVGVEGASGNRMGGTIAYNSYLGSYANYGMTFHTNNLNRMIIDASGRVGIGGTPNSWDTANVKVLQIKGTSLWTFGDGVASFVSTNVYYDGTNRRYIYSNYAPEYDQNAGCHQFFTTPSGSAGAVITQTKTMEINTSGYTKITKSGTQVGGGYHEIVNDTASDWTVYMRNTGATPYGIAMHYPVTSGTGYEFFYAYDLGGLKMSVRGNGGISNYQANDTNLSDIRNKKDISPLGSYWNKFKDIEIVKFKYKDQTHEDFNIGVIAQQVEAVAPEFVDVDGWDNLPNQEHSTEEPMKSIYTADLYHATIKVLQEAMAKIETLEAKVTALETK